MYVVLHLIYLFAHELDYVITHNKNSALALIILIVNA